MSIVKYRLKEVAADFAVSPKEIAEIISKFFEKPKSNTQVLTEEELNVVFDYLTYHNQISSLEQVFAVKAPAKEAPAAEPAKEQAKQPSQKPAEAAAKPQKPAEVAYLRINGNRLFPDHKCLRGRLSQFF